ncbi:hypothetical protein WDW37_03535 [Bdellovibrionota bacterium FG-1]
MTKSTIKTVVVGDGWSALAAVGFGLQRVAEQGSGKVIWISGTGSHFAAPLPGMESGPGVELWKLLANRFGVDPGEAISGSFLREFRNKAFREPLWMKAPTAEARQDALNECLWSAERKMAPLWETRFASLTFNEIEGLIRTRMADGSFAQLQRIEGVPLSGFRVEEGQARAVILASGEEISFDQAIFADRWSDLPRLSGLPKNLAFIRRRHPISLLQATFTHSVPVGSEVMEGFFGSLHKESGEEFERHLWGHFSSDGKQSYWTLGLAEDEVEDNHQIAKKLRKMKSALDKMFCGSSWLPGEKTEFMATVCAEQVRFKDSLWFADGEVPSHPVHIPGVQGLFFVTDGYGPAASIEQVAGILRPHAEAERVDCAPDSVVS